MDELARLADATGLGAISPGGVLVSPRVAAALTATLRAGLARAVADGYRISPEVADTVAAIETVGRAWREWRARQPAATPVGTPGTAVTAGSATMRSVEVAAALGVSSSYVRRLARTGGLFPVGHGRDGYRFDGGDVADLAARRAARWAS